MRTTITTTITTTTNDQCSPLRAILLALFACLQNASIGGLIYGWTAIDRGMLTASENGAGLSPAETTSIFSYATCVGMVATLVLGVILDRWGPRMCSAIAHVSIGIGCQLFAMSRTYSMFCLSTSLMAFGGPGIQISIVHLANLFPNNQFLVLSVLNGTISLSFLVFAIFDWIWQTYAPMDFRALFGCLTLIVIVSMIGSILFWPDAPFELPTPKDRHSPSHRTAEDDFIEATTAHSHLLEQPLDSYLRNDPRHLLERHESFNISKKALSKGYTEMVSLKDQPFRRQLFSGTFLRSLLMLTVTCFYANFYVASFSTEVADSLDYSSQEEHELARTLTMIMSAGVLASFLSGWLMDHLGLQQCSLFLLGIGVVHMTILIAFHHHQGWMVFGFLIYTVFRQLLFPLYIAFLTSHLGFKYFGLLNGLGFAIAGITQAFMAVLVEVVQGDCHLFVASADADEMATSSSVDCDSGHWTQLHVWQIVGLLGLAIAPVLERLEDKSRKKSIEATMMQSPLLQSSYGSITEEPEGISLGLSV